MTYALLLLLLLYPRRRRLLSSSMGGGGGVAVDLVLHGARDFIAFRRYYHRKMCFALLCCYIYIVILYWVPLLPLRIDAVAV